MTRTRLPLLAAFALLAGASTAASQARAPAEASTESPVPAELWGNVTLDFPKGDRWLFETDFEPKTLISGGEKWWNLDVTPLTEFYPSPWIDLVGETTFGYTRQTDDVNTRELTPRIGFRLNVLNNLRERTHFPLHALGRFRLATLVRFEYRNFSYSDGSPSQHSWRFRARVELKVGINHADSSLDKSLYGIFDAEEFVPLGEGVTERFVSKARMRSGLGYRLRYGTRFEILYIRDWHRDAKDSPRQPTADILDLRLKLFF
ncbi:MAG TPA: DUF2490 domain-containing protein [Thermoanaerobaculia bacterium]|nr:DUF2490 domain-containing protein [Thermoanaerobaculia bacterium]